MEYQKKKEKSCKLVVRNLFGKNILLMNLCNLFHALHAIDQTSKVIYKPKQCRVSNNAALLLLS